MQRFHQALLVASVLALSWLLMQAIHEFGHIAAAWATGGAFTRVVLHPLAISRTDVEPNPQPLVAAWGGPVIGVAIPLVLWGIATAARLPIAFLFQFFAGFCLVANGLYLGVGSFNGVGDAGDILRHGSPRWALVLFGVATAPAGMALWNGQGRAFGFGVGAANVSSRLACGCAIMVAIIIVLESIFFSP